MTRFKILGAAAILSLISATPVFAQAAIQEPGLFAFYYPNNDVLNGGRPTPAAGLNPPIPVLLGSNPYAAMENSTDGASCAARYRSYDPASGTFLGFDGRRHACEQTARSTMQSADTGHAGRDGCIGNDAAISMRYVQARTVAWRGASTAIRSARMTQAQQSSANGALLG